MNHCPKTRDAAVWYSNDTLPPDERRAFEIHLDTCPECRAALAFDDRLARTLQATATNVLPAPQTAWRRLEARLDAGENAQLPASEVGPGPARRPAIREGRARFMYFAVAAQAAAILVLVVALWITVQKPDGQTFRTLGTEGATIASPEPLVRVVFAPGYSATEAGRVAAAAGAELRSRFEGTEIYTLAVPVGAGESRADKLARVLASLRAHPDVRMAEPINDPQVPNRRP